MNPLIPHIEDHLLLLYLTGRAGAKERAAVEAWLQESEEHRSALDRLESLWLETGRLNPPPLAVDTGSAWNSVLSRISTHEEKSLSRRDKPDSVRFMRHALRIAAAIIILAGVVALIRLFTGHPKEVGLAASGTVLRDTLPDGSRIALNTHSRLMFPERFEGDVRRIRLIGEAFFEVTRDSLQPFVIDAGTATIKVLGTAFRVKAYPGKDLEVYVATGRVLLFRVGAHTGDTASVILSAGEHGILRVNANAPETVEQTLSDDLFWANRTLEFSSSPLSEVVVLLEKYYGITVSVSNPEILRCRLSATFLDDPPGRIMTVIAESFGLQLTSEGLNYQLTGDGCAKSVE